MTTDQWIMIYLFLGILWCLGCLWRQHKLKARLTFSAQVMIVIFWLPMLIILLLLRKW